MPDLMPYSNLTTHGEGPLIQVIEAQLHKIIRSILTHVEIDEEWYRVTYRDVDDAIFRGKISSAKEHYVYAGYFEDRFPRKFVVDEKWYLETYTDVAEAIKRGRFTNCQEHFEKDGYREGRLPYPDWKL